MSIRARAIESVAYQDGWGNLHSDILGTMAIEGNYKFRDLCNLACICKAWSLIVSNNNFGAERVKVANLQVKVISPNSWMKIYRNYLNVPQIFVLDVSGSMSYLWEEPALKRETVALEIIANLVSKLDEHICYGGLECIAFDERISIKKCTNSTDVLNFFSKDYKNEENMEEGAGHFGGTNITEVFKKLHKTQKEHLKTNWNADFCQATIISDFDDDVMKIDLFTEKKSDIHIQCFNLGNSPNFSKILEDYEKWVPLVAQRQLDIVKTINRMKRRNQSPPSEYEIPFNIRNVDQECWVPVQEKRKHLLKEENWMRSMRAPPIKFRLGSCTV